MLCTFSYFTNISSQMLLAITGIVVTNFISFVKTISVRKAQCNVYENEKKQKLIYLRVRIFIKFFEIISAYFNI